MTTVDGADPWQQALPKHGQIIQPLCKHIYDCLELSVGVNVVGVVPEPHPHPDFTYVLKVILKKEKDFSFTIVIQPSETGERVLKAKAALAQLIMKDPLLLNGVTRFNWCKKGSAYSGEIIFHGHTVDISSFFDGETLQTSCVINEIIRKVSSSSGASHVCSIGLVPIKGNIAFLGCENSASDKRYYEEANIRRWVSEHGTSPFTRMQVGLGDIKIKGPASVPISAQPRVPTSRKTVDVSGPASKKARVVQTKHVCLVWDISGSMHNMEEQSVTGCREMIEQQRAIAESSGNPTFLTLITFDNLIETRLDGKNILSVDTSNVSEWLHPRGSTRLYDAIHETSCILSKRVGDDESGILVFMTDGYDTGSETSAETAKNSLESLQSGKNVECIFMAANIGDAQLVGPSLGFSQDTSISFTPAAAGNAFRAASQSALRSVTGGSAAFTGVERQRSNAVRSQTTL